MTDPTSLAVKKRFFALGVAHNGKDITVDLGRSGGACMIIKYFIKRIGYLRNIYASKKPKIFHRLPSIVSFKFPHPLYQPMGPHPTTPYPHPPPPPMPCHHPRT